MQKYCYLNGSYCLANEAKVSIYDLSLLRGYGLFDYFRTYNGVPFSIQAHLDRFFDSAAEMEIAVPNTKDEIKVIINELIQKNELTDAGIRLVLTGGNSEDCYTPAKEGNFFVLVDELPNYDPKVWSEGIHLMTYEYQRPFPEIKSNNYITAVSLRKEQEKRGAFDILYTFNGNVLECTRSNFFGIKDGVIITAAKDVYKGRTRNITLEVAKEMPIEERFITLDEMLELDEAFVTGTTKKIMPVTTIDGRPVADGKVGEQTKLLMQLFDDYVASC